MLPKGTFRARAVEAQFGFADTGTEQVAVTFEITEGEFLGDHITWFGFFTDATAERTVQALRTCGWEGDDLTNVTGIDRNEVELVVAHEIYQGKTICRVQWINKPGNRVLLRNKMDDGQRAQLAARMKGLVLATRAPGSGKATAATPSAARPPARSTAANGKGYPPAWDANGL